MGALLRWQREYDRTKYIGFEPRKRGKVIDLGDPFETQGVVAWYFSGESVAKFAFSLTSGTFRKSCKCSYSFTRRGAKQRAEGQKEEAAHPGTRREGGIAEKLPRKRSLKI